MLQPWRWVAGLGVIILTSDFLYMVVKLAGGIYLIYLGVKFWYTRYQIIDSAIKNHKSSKSLFCEAFMVGITNPKAIAFYTALFPQFIVLEQPILPQFVALALTFAVLSFSALLMYAVVTSRTRCFLMKDKLNRLFNKITGGVFVTYGFALLFDNKA